MAAMREVCRVIVLGSTGSVGTQTLEVIQHLNALHDQGRWPTRYSVVGLAAGTRAEQLADQAARFGVRHTAIGTSDPAALNGNTAPERLVREVECDLVVAAIAGAAGLGATLAAVELGRDVALANKETLVAAGALIIEAAHRSGARLLPIDSEHSAVWQCLCGVSERAGNGPAAPPMSADADVARVILTASGGPFRTWTSAEIDRATPEQALNHPTWRMGPKVTVDCASLMNKGLELIEAHWLFGLSADRLGVVIHPQSLVHAIVELADGSALAQLGATDMRGPIQFAFTYPGRAAGAHRALSWSEARALTFEPPDDARFPAVQLAFRAIREGGTAGAVLNAANEAAVQAFLAGRIPFGRIAGLVARAMDALGSTAAHTLSEVLRADAQARAHVEEQLR